MVEAHKDNFRLGGSEITLTSDVSILYNAGGCPSLLLRRSRRRGRVQKVEYAHNPSFTASWIFHLDNTVRIEDLMKFFIYIVEKK